MATPSLPPDFKELLQSFNAERVSYLLVGGYAVSFYGYVRATADMDLWLDRTPENASRVLAALNRFGANSPELTIELLLTPHCIVRMGVPPLRLELLSDVSGVAFDQCYQRRTIAELDGVMVSIISLDDLKANKRASGRSKDLGDLEHLP